LAHLGIKTVGDLAYHPVTDLVRWFGETGNDLSRRARGVDESPVTTEHEVKSISQEITFSRDEQDDQLVAGTLRKLSAQVGLRLRRAGFAGTTVKLKLRWPDFTTLTRQITIPHPIDQDEEIYRLSRDLLGKVRPKGKAVRLIGVGVSGLGLPMRQLELWNEASEKSRRLQMTLDELRARFGEDSIHLGKNDG
jgi:DNA polymerase-4